MIKGQGSGVGQNARGTEHGAQGSEVRATEPQRSAGTQMAQSSDSGQESEVSSQNKSKPEAQGGQRGRKRAEGWSGIPL